MESSLSLAPITAILLGLKTQLRFSMPKPLVPPYCEEAVSTLIYRISAIKLYLAENASFTFQQLPFVELK
jgi:hypothetical protein